MASSAATALKEPTPKVSAKAKPKANLKAVPKPTAKKTVTRHKFDGDKIKVIGKEIPVRSGTNRRDIFELFKSGMTVSEFLAAARPMRGGAEDIQIALAKNYIELS
tara:strand:+ start:153 stop:470 length:318 start_codon:yes stop_codon:yes gene_type:complete